MILTHRISVLAHFYTRPIVFARTIHVESDADEKLVRLSKFDLSKPLIGRTHGK